MCPALLGALAVIWCDGFLLTAAAEAAPLNWRPYRAPAIVPVEAEEAAERAAAVETVPVASPLDPHADKFPTAADEDDHFPPAMTKPNLLPAASAKQLAAPASRIVKGQPTLAKPVASPTATPQPRSALKPSPSARGQGEGKVNRAAATQPTKVRDRVLQVAAQQPTSDNELFDPFADDPTSKKQLDEAVKGLDLDKDQPATTTRGGEVEPEPALPRSGEPSEATRTTADPDPSLDAIPSDEAQPAAEPAPRSLDEVSPDSDGTDSANPDFNLPGLDDDYYRPEGRFRGDASRQTDCSEEKADCADAYARLKNNTLANIDLSIDVTGVEGLDYPCECPFAVGETFEGRNWPKITYHWKASGLCHKPLYFEQVAVERYGHSALPVLQDIISGAHFFASVAVLPYSMGLCPPEECEYSLGYYRPGNCAPYLVDPIPLSVRAGLFQASAIVGGILILP